ncbi:MAG TPA: glycosyltransferase [Pyrinomonadaceae bacterium]
MKKNVLQLVGSFHQGGSERQAVQLARLLREDGNFHVFLAALNREGVLFSEAGKAGFAAIPEFPLTSFYDLNFLKQIKKCARLLRENKIEIVHTHDFYTNVFGILAARLAKVPVKIASKRETGGMRSGAQKQIEKRIFSVADAIVANSKAVREFLRETGVPSEKIDVIYNGLDLARLEPAGTTRAEICAEFDLPVGENIKFITLVANLRHKIKNQPMFLRAAHRISQRVPGAHFVLAGEGELKNDLESLARELNIAGKTHFIGRCTKIPELLSISFAGVLTSVSEGFSNSILEYMAARLPVVATRVGGAGEAIIEDENGFLIESGDDEALAEKLNFLLENPEKARQSGERGRKFVEERFSCDAQLENTLKLYERKLNGK